MAIKEGKSGPRVSQADVSKIKREVVEAIDSHPESNTLTVSEIVGRVDEVVIVARPMIPLVGIKARPAFVKLLADVVVEGPPVADPA